MSFDSKFFITGAAFESIKHIPVTLYVSAAVMLISIIIGFVIALVRCYKVPYAASIFQFLVTVLRGIPLVLFLLIFQAVVASTYNDFWASLGLNLTYRNLNKALIAIAAMSIPMSINMSEIFRGAFSSVERAQFDASRAIGHSGAQTLFRVVLPQMVPVVIPMTGNVIISTVKATSLLMYVTVIDVLNAAVMAASFNYKLMEAYFAAALVFWAMCASLEYLFHNLEKKIKLQKSN